MKPLSYLPYILILALGVWVFLLLTEKGVEDRVRQSEIDGLRIKNIMAERAFLKTVDSLMKIQVMQADSTKYYRLLKTKDQQTVTTKTESHEKIVFVNLNDSARHGKLAKFYPSYVRP